MNAGDDFTRCFDQTMRILRGRGLLLAAYDAKGHPNAMTIGWAALGNVWSNPLWMVMVRPSRYTYECIEASKAFSVCVPGKDLEEACEVCGSQSGRFTDKLTALKLAVARGEAVNAPILPACPILYECRVVNVNDVDRARLDLEIEASAYGGDDYHRVYWGRIERVHVADDAETRLAE